MPKFNRPVQLDIAFGGMFYAVVHTDAINDFPKLLPENAKDIAAFGADILVRLTRNSEIPSINFASNMTQFWPNVLAV